MNAEEWEEWEESEVLPTHPIKNGRWVVSVAEIRCNATGEVSEYEGPELLMDGDESPNTHIWSDGNFGCDCNRRFFFSRAGGKDEDGNGECSEGLYSVRVRNKKSGRVFYSEFDR